MTIEKSFLYSIKDSAKITNIPARTLSRIALANNNRKIDGRYLFLGSQLETLIEKRIEKEKNLANRSPTPRQTKENKAILKTSKTVISVDEYNRLKEENQKIIFQQEVFDAKEKGLNDVVNLMTEQADHYKNQFQYQKEQATRILDMHEQLIKTIQQNNFIEAKSKGFDKE